LADIGDNSGVAASVAAPGPPLPDHFLWLSLPAICHRHDQDDAITTFDQRGMPPASAAYSGAAASLIQF
jgi:hypothetical protein